MLKKRENLSTIYDESAYNCQFNGHHLWDFGCVSSLFYILEYNSTYFIILHQAICRNKFDVIDNNVKMSLYTMISNCVTFKSNRIMVKSNLSIIHSIFFELNKLNSVAFSVEMFIVFLEALRNI